MTFDNWWHSRTTKAEPLPWVKEACKAAWVAASQTEREACAKLCEAINLEYQIEAEKGNLKGVRWNRNMWKSRAAGECELAIRKRSNV